MRHTLRLNTLKAILRESVLACLAATLCILLGIPVSAMFIGWIAFFTRGITARDGLINLECLLIGLAIGIGAPRWRPFWSCPWLAPWEFLRGCWQAGCKDIGAKPNILI